MRVFAMTMGGTIALLSLSAQAQQQPSIGHLRQASVEIFCLRQALPEGAASVLCFILARRHPKQSTRSLIEVGEHAVAIQE